MPSWQDRFSAYVLLIFRPCPELVLYLFAGLPVLARITLDALPGQTFAGKLRRIAPYVTEVEKQAA